MSDAVVVPDGRDLENASGCTQRVSLVNLQILQFQRLKDATSQMLFCSLKPLVLMISLGLISWRNLQGKLQA